MSDGDEGRGELQDSGALYLVGTPIGNLEDITYRAIRILGEVDLVAAEDTRKAQILLNHYQIKAKTISLFEGNEQRRSAELVEKIRQGASIALISEAGMPAISDPGWVLLRQAVAEGLLVDVIPGPSAVLTALVLSGLPTDRFSWLGFVPRKGRRREQLLRRVAEADETVVLFEAPGRTAHTLRDLAVAAGPEREGAVTRELTKRHQQAVRGPLARLAELYAGQAPRGEVTLVIAGRPPPAPLTDEALAELVQARLEAGESPRNISDELASHGKRRVYQLALALDREAD